jgi:enoyl-CoA hydratase/carnithine racemase
MPNNTPPLLLLKGAVATIKLNRGQYKNRLHNDDVKLLLQYCDQINNNAEIRVVVLTSEVNTNGKPVFCAGFHVGDFDSGEPVVPFEKLPDAIEALNAVTVCVMPGSVYGGATDVALACDFRLGIEGMELRMPAAALGLHYYPSGLARYVSRLGVGAAKKAFLTASNWTDAELLKVGYLDAIYSASELNVRANVLIEQIQNLAPMAVSGMKRSLNELASTGATASNIENIRIREAACAASDDFIEGRAAFAERRQPRFRGK